MIQKDID